jgi:hypothetical protein
MVLWVGLEVVMSVVNDILKDLHDRRSQQNYHDYMPFVYESETSSSLNTTRNISLLLLISVAICIAYFYSGFSYQNNLAVMPYVVPNDEIEGLKNNVVLSSLPIALKKSAELASDFELLSDIKEVSLVAAIAQKSSSQLSTIKTTNTTVTPPKYALKVNTLDHEKQKLLNVPSTSKVKFLPVHTKKEKMKSNNLIRPVKTRTDNRLKDEDIIKKLMKNEPERVWPYIKKILPLSKNKIGLMALGAQGEQRSDNHNTALSLYKTLSEIEPKESKWKVGSAISFDAIGKNREALLYYKHALQLGQLPPVLHSFVTQRISLLSDH